MAIGDPVQINVNTVTVNSVRFVVTEGGVPTNQALSFVSVTYDAADTAQNEPILAVDFVNARPVYTPDTSRVQLLSNGGTSAVKDVNGKALPADTEIWYQTPAIPAPTQNSEVTAEYVDGAGATATSPVDPNALASVVGPVRVKFISTEIA